MVLVVILFLGFLFGPLPNVRGNIILRTHMLILLLLLLLLLFYYFNTIHRLLLALLL